MGFFLLGRGRAGGEMRLISTEVYADRSSAMDALAALSAEPGFAHRDADVFVSDLDQAVPVLLVAPAAPAPVSEDVPEAVSESVVVEADIEVASDDVSGDVSAEEESEEPQEPEAPTEEEPAELEAPAPVEQPGESESDEAEPEAGVSTLAEALRGAAGALESSGIVAPQSVGPAPADDSASPGVAAEPGSWPWEKTSGGGEQAVEQQDVYTPSPFEEPAVDAGDLVVTPVDGEETPEGSRPVIMGDYSDDQAEVPAPPVMDFSEPTGEVDLIFESPPEVPAPPAVELADEEISADDVTASILADLETIEDPVSLSADAGAAIESPEPDAVDQGVEAVETATLDTSELTCDDCVYVNTCPNQDGLNPSSCGNFQWKSI